MKRLFQSDIFRNVSVLVSGTVLAQLIPIVLQVFLRRVYSPEIYGAFSVYLSIISILLYVYTLRYEFAIVNPKENKKAINLFSVVIFSSILWAFIFSIIVLLFKDSIADLINFPTKYSNWLYVLPFIVMIYGFYQGIQYWLIREKSFKAISVNKFTRRASEGTFQVLFGYLSKAFGLVVGNFVGALSNVIAGFYQAKRKGLDLKEINIKTIKNVLHKYREYPLFNLLPSLLNTAGIMLPIFFINKFYGSYSTGQLDLTRMVLAVPSALLSVSLSQVFLQRFSEKKKLKQSILNDFKYLVLFLVSVSFTVTVIIHFWGIELFTLVFGGEWNEAGLFAEILIYKYALIFLVSPLSIIFIALEKIKISSIWQASYFFLILSLYYFRSTDIIDFLNKYVIIELTAYFLYFCLIIYVLIKYEKSVK